MLNTPPAFLIANLIVLFFALPFHEFSHALAATRLGDDTPRINGRLTINPLAHLDIFGSLMLVVAGFGWAKPVPVNPYALQRRSPAALMLVSLAGPMSNFLMAVLAAIPFRLGWVHFSYSASGLLPTIDLVMTQFVVINLSLMLFNLLPLAPLDGDKIADYLFPPSWSRALERIRPYGSIILLALLFVLPMIGVDVIGWVISPALIRMLSILGVYA